MDFLELLESFNRKERFFLIAYALGNPTFKLDPKFAGELSRVTGVAVPADACAFMDYHLDWLHAAGYLSHPNFVEAARYENPEAARINVGNQEDIDLVVAFRALGETQLILIEAKLDTGWTNKQLDSKARRLGAIFGATGSDVRGVNPTFVLASPRESKGLVTASWPAWMRREDGRPRWMELTMPLGRRRVEGCDENGRPAAARRYFRIIS